MHVVRWGTGPDGYQMAGRHARGPTQVCNKASGELVKQKS